jgi:hypothetical protein
MHAVLEAAIVTTVTIYGQWKIEDNTFFSCSKFKFFAHVKLLECKANTIMIKFKANGSDLILTFKTNKHLTSMETTEKDLVSELQ